MTASRRGVILPVVLLVLVLLGLLVAMFSFRVNADLAASRAMELRVQTRLAAEAGIDRVKLLLLESRFDQERWYHNIDELHRIIVWRFEGDETKWGTNDEFEDDTTMGYRFSIVADDMTDDEYLVRFGITDEASKLNLNTATEAQLRRLIHSVVEESEEVVPDQIVDAILDWRDNDRRPRGEMRDTEGVYYKRLPKPYSVKNGPFDTVEELLLVKGVTHEILYGEDSDRNGLLTPNEEDGDESYPPDNEDQILNLGLYPYLTVLSEETNVSNDNRRRIYLMGEENTVRAELGILFPDDPDVVDFIVDATRPPKKPTGKGSTGKKVLGSAQEEQDPPGRVGKGDPQAGGVVSDPKSGQVEPLGGEGKEGPEGESGPETVGGQDTSAPIRSPASLMLDRMIDGEQQPSPVTAEHLAILMDRTTVVDPKQETIPGLININTAPRMVLQLLPGLAPEQVDAILEARDRQGEEAKMTPAWLVQEDVLDIETFERIAPMITARAQQFTIESLGYADHIGMVTRLHVVVDLVGPFVQAIYYRDLSYLGSHFPIREEDLETQRAR